MTTKNEKKEYFEKLKKDVEKVIKNISDSKMEEQKKWNLIDELLEKLKEIEKLIIENTDY